MSSITTISLCMIVKNEASQIERCLLSVRDQVDEMIIVDTGSDDNTQELIKKFGAKVIQHKWNDNFAEARNVGIAEAKGDWILWLDADEKLESLPPGRLRKLLSTAVEPIQAVHLVNFTEETEIDESAHHIFHTRLFRNHIGFKFVYSIHETLNAEEVFRQRNEEPSIGKLPIKLYHYGYINNESTAAKHERNLNLLLKAKENNEDNVWIDYHIASEYYRIKRYDKAFLGINSAIKNFLDRGLVPQALVYKLKYGIMIAANSPQTAWPGIEKAIALYPDYVDLHFYKGIILIAREDYEAAEEAFNRCLELGEGNYDHLTLYGTGSFLPLFYKGFISAQLGDKQQAIKYLTEAIALNPHFQEAKTELERIQNK